MSIESSHRGSGIDPVRVIVLDAADGDSCMDTANNALRVNLVVGGAGDGAIQDGVTSTIEATVFDYTNSNPLAVRLTDTNGDAVTAQPVTDNGGNLSVDWAGTAPPIGAGLEATALRVTVATDSTGVLSVDDNAGSLTVDQGVAGTAWEQVGDVAHDAVGTSVNPVLVGGYASAAAPTGVSLDGDAVRTWHLLNGAQATVITAAGALIAGDAANGLDVDVTRLPALVAGTANIGDVDVLTLPALVAGTANIGDVDVLTIAAGDNNIGNVDIVTMPTGATAAAVQGTVAHDGVDAQNPIGVGYRAIAHGTNPTAVAAADRTVGYANRAGIPFILGGHPNVVTIEAAYTAAQTDAAIVTIATGLKIVVTQIQMTADNANTVDVGFRVGFGATTTPTTTGVVLTHPGVAAGSGISRGDGSGILGIGADNEDLRITSEVPTTGSIRILVTYFTVES